MESTMNELQPTPDRVVLHYRSVLTCVEKTWLEDEEVFHIRLEDQSTDGVGAVEFKAPPGNEADQFEVGTMFSSDNALEAVEF